MRVVRGYSRDAWLAHFNLLKREFRKLFFVTRDLKVWRDPWRTRIIALYSWFCHSILRGFGMQVLRIVRVVYQIWFRPSIWNMEPWLSYSRFCFLQTLFLMSLKRVSCFLIFVIREKEFFMSVNRDPLFFRFVNRARAFPCTTLKQGIETRA